MKIEVNITKKHFFVVLGFFLALTFGFFACAYNSSPAVPSNFGHSISEIDAPVCSSNQVLTHTASGWMCSNLSAINNVGKIIGEFNVTYSYYPSSNVTSLLWGNCSSASNYIYAVKSIIHACSGCNHNGCTVTCSEEVGAAGILCVG